MIFNHFLIDVRKTKMLGKPGFQLLTRYKIFVIAMQIFGYIQYSTRTRYCEFYSIKYSVVFGILELRFHGYLTKR